jgi:hypothetical protein
LSWQLIVGASVVFLTLLYKSGALAECHSATQQTTSLRYGALAKIGNQLLLHHAIWPEIRKLF